MKKKLMLIMGCRLRCSVTPFFFRNGASSPPGAARRTKSPGTASQW